MRENVTKPQKNASAERTNSFSEQEELMTNGKMPPEFELKANSDDEIPFDPKHKLTSQGIAEAWNALGLNAEDYAHLDDDLARKLIPVSTNFVSSEWNTLFQAFRKHELEAQIAEIYDAFYEKQNWMTSPDATVLETLENMTYSSETGSKTGTIELVRLGEKIGMRAVVPYEGFGGKLILDPEKTTTVLGRAVDQTAHEDGYAAAMNQPIGTNYFRYLKDFMVGKNKGGGNVLDVSDNQWSWPLNNAWLQASVDRGDKIRFVSDPTLPTTIFKDGKGQDPTLTVTGQELGVLINKDLAPSAATGNVENYAVTDDEAMPKPWRAAKEQVVEKGDLNDLDKEAYDFFLEGSQSPNRAPKEYKSKGKVLATQSNLFGFEGQESA